MKIKIILLLLSILMLFTLFGCNSANDDSVKSLNNDLDKNSIDKNGEKKEKMSKEEAYELLWKYLDWDDSEKQTFKYIGDNCFGSYIYMKTNETTGSPIPYAVDPYTGNVYDDIGHSLITNLFMDKDKIEILSEDEILRLLSEKIITDKPENSYLVTGGYHKGYVIVILAIQKENQTRCEILREFKIDSITGDV